MRFPDDVPVRSDGTVTLRAAVAEDAEGVYEQCTDPVMQQFTTVPVPYTRQDAADFVGRRAEKWADGSDWGFSIEVDGGAEPTRFGGSIGICPGAPGVGEIAFGAHPRVRGKGVMTRAVALICDWAFEEQGLRRIEWQCNAGNLASWRVVWRNGFTFEGSARSLLPQRGELLDGWRGALLAVDSREPKTRWLAPVQLTGERVVLRGVVADDERRFLESLNDPTSLRWLGTIPGLPRDEASFAARLRDRGLAASLGQHLGWTVADRYDDNYLGSIDMFGFSSIDHRSAEVGYRMHPDARGKGLLAEGLRLVVRHAFASDGEGGLDLQRLSLGAGDGNDASQAVARAVGFVETGRDRRCYLLDDGSVVDLVRFDLLR